VKKNGERRERASIVLRFSCQRKAVVCFICREGKEGREEKAGKSVGGKKKGGGFRRIGRNGQGVSP